MSASVTEISNVSRNQNIKLENVDDEYKTRCGEIFMTQNKLFTFHCSFCNNGIYEDFNYLLDHITTKHLAEFECTIEEVSTDELIEDLRTNDTERIEYEDLATNDSNIKAAYDEVYQELSVDILHPIESITVPGIIDIKEEIDINSDCSTEEWHTKKRRRQESVDKVRYFECEFCGRKFNQKSKWRYHIIIHSDERKHKCDQCGQAFKADYNLRAHLRRHSGVKDYDCAHCQRKFHTSTELATHERRAHTGERPYICTRCGVGFITSGLLREHMKRHNNEKLFKCLFCDKTFYNPQLRKDHEIVHTKERNHICSVCHATFGRRKGLLVHMKLHENAREYACDLCDAAFNQKQSLIAHKKTKHRILSTGKITVLPQISAIVEGNTTCTQCKMKFPNVVSMLEHEQRMHAAQQEVILNIA